MVWLWVGIGVLLLLVFVGVVTVWSEQRSWRRAPDALDQAMVSFGRGQLRETLKALPQVVFASGRYTAEQASLTIKTLGVLDDIQRQCSHRWIDTGELVNALRPVSSAKDPITVDSALLAPVRSFFQEYQKVGSLKNLEVESFLLNAEKTTPLMRAVRDDDKDSILKLLDGGACADEGLIEAASLGNLELVKLLVERGATLDFEGEAWSALAISVFNEVDDAVPLYLVSCGANVNVHEPENRMTVLMFAASKGNRRLVEALIANGANLDAMDVDKRTAADFAANEDIKRIVAGSRI